MDITFHVGDIRHDGVWGGTSFNVNVLPDGNVIAPPWLAVGVEVVLVRVRRQLLGRVFFNGWRPESVLCGIFWWCGACN